MNADTGHVLSEYRFPVKTSNTWEVVQTDIEAYEAPVYIVLSVADVLNGFNEVAIDKVEMIDGDCVALGE